MTIGEGFAMTGGEICKAALYDGVPKRVRHDFNFFICTFAHPRICTFSTYPNFIATFWIKLKFMPAVYYI